MKATVVGLVTPHVLRVLDLAKQAEAGTNVDWHLRDAVARTVEDLGQQFNARELLSAYAQGLESVAKDVGPGRDRYVALLHTAAGAAAREIERLG